MDSNIVAFVQDGFMCFSALPSRVFVDLTTAELTFEVSLAAPKFFVLVLKIVEMPLDFIPFFFGNLPGDHGYWASLRC